MSNETEEFKLYPIQATNIGVRELFIKALRPPTLEIAIDESEFDLAVGHSTYDEAEKSIQISVSLSIGERSNEQSGKEIPNEEKAKLPFHMKIDMVGFFHVDDAVFPIARIYEWAKINAIFIMYPFLREHVFALTARMGFRPMLLPLVEVPTVKLQQTLPPAAIGSASTAEAAAPLNSEDPR